MEYDYSCIEIEWGDDTVLKVYSICGCTFPIVCFRLCVSNFEVSSVGMKFYSLDHMREELVKMARGEVSECGGLGFNRIYPADYINSDGHMVYTRNLNVGAKAFNQLKAEILKRFDKPKKRILYVDLSEVDEVRTKTHRSEDFSAVLWSRG